MLNVMDSGGDPMAHPRGVALNVGCGQLERIVKGREVLATVRKFLPGRLRSTSTILPPIKTYISISFRSALSLEELAHAIGLNPVEFDAENQDEWALGTLGPFDDIDIARSHLVQPAETRTSICRFKHGPDRGMPASFLQGIHVALKTVATEFEAHGTEHGQSFKLIGAAIDSL
jgi:hypothetical protein